MRIKKNGTVINLSERDIKKLNKSLLMEQSFYEDMSVYEKDTRSDALKECLEEAYIDSYDPRKWKGNLPEMCIVATSITGQIGWGYGLGCTELLEIGSEGEPDNTNDINKAMKCIKNVFLDLHKSFDWLK